jgi:hypothetical protein
MTVSAGPIATPPAAITDTINSRVAITHGWRNRPRPVPNVFAPAVSYHPREATVLNEHP